MFKKASICLFLGLLLPTLVLFYSLLVPGPAVWGDAPYFYPETLKELVSEPEVWTERGTLLGGVNNLLWISPLMFIYGLLNTTFGLTNDIIVRLLFYFPAIVFSYFGSWFFAKSLGLSHTVRFFVALVYTFNTYFLLLVDGGQVGIALAYGLFPVSLWALRRFFLNSSFNNFYLGLVFLFVLGIADPRFSFIALVTLTIWYFLETLFKEIKLKYHIISKFLLLCLVYLLVSSYWLYPTLMLGSALGTASDFVPTSVLNALLLYQPHWPLNEFGKIIPPQFYFVGVPILIFSNLFFRTRKILIILLAFLAFAFLAKGPGEPAGVFYGWALENIPFANSFRDSTKFFAPLILFAGILIGNFANSLFELLKRRPVVAYGSLVFLWAYLLFLLYPAFGGLGGVLSLKHTTREFVDIGELVAKDPNFSRSVWFPEKHPFVFQNSAHPAVDARELVGLRPLATLNVGTLDRYNFLHDPTSTDWLKVLGLKYLVLSGDFRKSQNVEEKEDWNNLIRLLESKKGLKKQGSLSLWEVEGALPHSYAVEKLIAVVGADDIYEKMGEKVPGFGLGKQGFVFFEDGKLDPKRLEAIASESAVIVFNDKSEEDLTLSFLQKYFLGPEAAKGSWAIRPAGDYLKWKYELLTQGIKTREFDYSRGVAFSSQAAEKITFKTNLVAPGQYVIAVRSMSSTASELKVTVRGGGFKIATNSRPVFTWSIVQGFEFPSGPLEIELENTSGFQVINVVAVIPKQEWGYALDTTHQFEKHFNSVSVMDETFSSDLGNFLTSNQNPKNNWLILTDSWNPFWKVQKGKDSFYSLPIYSAVNGFYTERVDRPILVFEGQKYFKWGLWASLLSILSLSTYFIYSKTKQNV